RSPRHLSPRQPPVEPAARIARRSPTKSGLKPALSSASSPLARALRAARFPGGCPRTELIAALIDGMISLEDQAAVAAHIVLCNHCFELFRARPR
ncbi:MAG: zf-HC2 domain-containing protein, partial [Fimbriimonadales bacterium]